MKRKFRLTISILMIACLCMTPLTGYAVNEDTTQSPVVEQGAPVQGMPVMDEDSVPAENPVTDVPEGQNKDAQPVSEDKPAGTSGSQEPRVDGEVVESTSNPLDVAAHIDEHWEQGSYQENGSDYQLERVIVRTEGEISDSAGATDAIHNSSTDEYILEYDSKKETKAAYESLKKEYGEENVMIDTLMTIWGGISYSGSGSDCVDWGTHLMGLDSLKTESKADHQVIAPKHVTVAILDTGINASHKMFKGRFIRSESKSFIPSSSALRDDHGHGSHVAGILEDGICKHVDFLILKVMDRKGQGGMYNVINAIDYAVDHGADVINMSIGVDGIKPNSTGYKMMEKSMERARAKGAVLVTAAGNGNGSKGKNIGKVYSYPAYSKHTIAVGAIGPDLKRASFSYYGRDLDFVAAGKAVRSAWKGGASSYKTLSGTSMASPEIAAAAAMVKVEHPHYDMDEVYEVMMEDSLDLGSKGRDRYYGNGIVRMNTVSATAVHKNLLHEDLINTDAHKSSVKAVKLRLVYGARKAIRVSWSKGRHIQGYQIRYSKKKNMKNAKYKLIPKASKTKIKLKKLGKKQVWYVQVRAFKKVDGEVYCSKWSGKKRVKTK